MKTLPPNKLFDIQERARLGLNYLTCNVDRRRGCLPYFAIMFKNDPAEARHDFPDFGDLTGRYVEAFVGVRRILGISEPTDIELALRALLLSYFDEGDGLSYRPKFEKPYYSTILRRPYNQHVAEGFDQSRVLWGLMAWFDDTQDQEIYERINQLINGLDRVIIKRGDYGYYDRSSFEPGFIPDPCAEPMPHQFYFCGPQIHPLIECYLKYGNEKAGHLAERLTRFIVHHSNYFFEDGRWNCPGGAGFESAEMDGHVHSRFATIAGIIRVGWATGDSYLVEFMKRCYDWFESHHCSSSGWCPEFLGRFGDANEGCETCALMDQLNCCFALCESGYSEYYEKAERIVRNQLMENQMLDTSLVRNTIEKEDTELSCFHNVAAMVKGGFAGWAGPNDFIGNCVHHYCLMGCCGPAGLRAFYETWRNIVVQVSDRIMINLFMDTQNKYAIIKNKQPVDGRMDIEFLTQGQVFLSPRSWLKSVIVKRSSEDPGVAIPCRKSGFHLGAARPGQKISVIYNVQEKIESTMVNGRHYRFTWRGDTVVDVDPKGKIMPFYQNRK